MAEQEGYIKINRNILRWGWYNNLKTCHLFFHLIIRANYKDGIFMGTKIGRGQLATSHGTLGNETGLTIDEVRTALRHLESTGEITVKRKPRYIVITVVKYSEYQDVPNQIPINSQDNPNQIPIKSQSNPNKRKKVRREEGKERKNKGRSAPDSPSAGKPMPDIDKGTVDDIPALYRDRFDNYADYWRYRNQ